MSEGRIITDLLIEGFDPSKLETEEQKREEAWKKIIGAYQNKKFITATMTSIEELEIKNKKEPCAVVEIDGIRGYIPMNEFGVDKKSQLRAFGGQKINFTIMNYDRENDIFVGSRKEALKIMRDIWLKSDVKEGDIIPAVVRYVTPKLIRADIGGIEVKIPIEEVRYGWIDDLPSEYPVGTHMLVKVLEIDKSDPDDIVVKVSGKQAQKNPFPDCLKRYKKGTEAVGTVSGVTEYGVFVNLEAGVDSLARHLKYEPLQKGDRVLVRILDADANKEHISAKILRIVEKKR